ncbi:MAG: hypothetical protein E6Q97_31135 [Desulfurellales bacterium]|nr:MAG: hypothetical protein E6Q97_31135 [Desulfurellales bacterium]
MAELLGKLVPLPLTARSFQNRVRTIGSPVLSNGVAEMAGEGRSRAPSFPITPREGLLPFSRPDAPGAFRGGFEFDSSTMYAAVGEKLFRVDGEGVSRLVGALPGSAPVRFARNRRTSPQIVAVTGGQAHVIEGGNISPLPVPSPGVGFISPIDVDFLLGYVLFITRSGTMHFTGIDDVSSLSSLNFLTAEINTDGLLRVLTRKLEAWLFGERSIEVWVATGDLERPFQRLQGAYIERGIAAPQSLVKVRDRAVWVADDLDVVMVGDGYSPESISSTSIVREIEGLGKAVASLEGCTYSIGGHDKYVLSCGSWTRVYDFHTREWSDFKTDGMARWRAGKAVQFGTRYVLGDVDAPDLYVVSEKAYRDGDRPIVLSTVLPALTSHPAALSFFDFHLAIECGPTPGVARIRWTDDGGRNWSPWRSRPMVNDGRSVRFGGLGQSGRNGRQFEIAFEAAEGRSLVGGTAHVGQVSYP